MKNRATTTTIDTNIDARIRQKLIVHKHVVMQYPMVQKMMAIAIRKAANTIYITSLQMRV